MPAARTKFSAVPVEKPLPLWVLYPLVFVAMYLAHYPLLRLPYFWDEAGYYIPAAIDFFRTGALIPHSTLTNAHPPLPAILLSGWWHLAGTAIGGTRTFVLMLASAALVAVFRLARLLAGPAVAATVTVLTGLYPVWFVQSTLAHADLFAAVFTLWGLSFYFERYRAGARATRLRTFLLVAGMFSLAVLAKETAVVTPVVLAVWEAVLLATEHRRRNPLTSLTWMAALATPVLPLALWYLYHFRHTGFVFGNPEFLRYNATANLTPLRVSISLWHRANHLLLHMNLYVPLLVTLGVLWLPRRPTGAVAGEHTAVLAPPAPTALAVVVLGNALAFSVLGGALLTRYLLPLYPLLLLLAVAVWRTRLRVWAGLAALTAGAFAVALFVNPPYSFAPEDNLTYRDMIVLHQRAAAVLAKDYPGAKVLTAWPATAELAHPELGYVRTPIDSVAIDNFSAAEIAKAAAEPGAYDTALVFSTKWLPAPGRLNLLRSTEKTDTNFYDFHRDLGPAEVAARLGGTVVWQGAKNGEWAAVLAFPRTHDAALPARRGERGVL